MIKSANSSSRTGSTNSPWYLTWKGYVVGATALVGAVVTFFDALDKFLLRAEGWLPMEVAVKIPGSATQRRDGAIHAALTSRNVTEQTLEKLFDPPKSRNVSDIRGRKISYALYEFKEGILYISRLDDAILGWVFAPSILPPSILLDLEKSDLNNMISIAQIPKKYDEKFITVTDYNSNGTYSVLSFSSSSSYYNVPSYGVSYYFSPKLDCTKPSEQGRMFGLDKLTCKNRHLQGRISLIAYYEGPDLSDSIFTDGRVSPQELMDTVQRLTSKMQLELVRRSMSNFLHE